MDFLNVDSGWQEVEPLCDGVNCAEDFTLQYYFADSGASATAIQKNLISIYSDAAEKAYWLFTPDQQTQEYSNVYTINHNPNREIVVDPVLYEAFSLLAEHENRDIYLGPIYQQYDNIFFSTDDAQAAYWDPNLDEMIAKLNAEGIHVGRWQMGMGEECDGMCDRVGSEYWRNSIKR